MKRERLERPDLWNQTEEERNQARSESRLLVVSVPIFSILPAGEIVDKLLPGETRRGLHELLASHAPGSFSHGRDQGGDGKAVSTNRQRLVDNDALQFQRIGLRECSFERGLGNLKTDELMVGVRSVI